MSEPQQAQATRDKDRIAPRSTNVIVQIKVKLLGVSKPPVWRQLQLPADTRLDHLHDIIVAAFGWENYHMHMFTSGADEFGELDPELEFNDERRVSLGQLIGGIGDRLRYTYDFGDDWEHQIVVEDLLDPDPEIHYPVLVAAKGACPPEDCGGPWGYTDLKAILADPSHGQHQETVDWLGLDNTTEFDPNAIATDHTEYELALNGTSR
jgi:hypothetical protein